MQSKKSYVVARCYQNSLLIELYAILESMEFTLAERHKLWSMFEDCFKSDAGLLTLLIGV